MTTIHAKLQDQVLVATILPKVACNNQNTVKLCVEFDPSWGDLISKRAMFYTSNDPTVYPVPLSLKSGVGNGTWECTVPAEVLADAGYLYITIQGANSYTGLIKSSTPINYKILPGTPSLVVSDPSTSVYNRLMTSYGDVGRELAVLMESINNVIIALEDGITAEDTELQNIRTDYTGETHAIAGDAVRSQGEMFFKGLTSESIVDCLKIRRTYYYLGNTSIDTNAVDNCKMRSKLCDVAAYQAAFEEYGKAGGSPCAIVAELNSPLPVSTDFSKYSLVIDTDVADNVSIRFSSGLSWSASETVKGLYTRFEKGINIIPLDITNASNNWHQYFKYASIQTTALTTATRFDAYIVSDSALIDYLTDKINGLRRDMVYVDLDTQPEASTKNLECDVSYADSLLSIHLPEKTTAEAEWRFAIVSLKLGKDIAGRKLLIRRNTNNIRSFGIGVSTSRWAEKNFSTDHDIHEIDLSEFIADNPTLAAHTGDYYLIVGIEAANTSTHNREYNESVNVMEITGAAESLSPIARLAKFDPSKYALKNQEYIVCWGDSLTAGAGWTDRLATLSGMTLHNAGTGGESARTIMARQGADAIMVNNIAIPAEVAPVTIATYSAPLVTAFGYNATPLLQGGANHVNPVKIGDIEGTLAWTGSSYNDTKGTWTFTRSTAGARTVINRPTAMTTAFDREKNAPHLMVIFMGQNGGYNSDDDELVNMHRLMINHAKATHTIVLGLSSGDATSRADYETAMKKAFGRYFINLREYLSKYGLADAGLTATAADTEAMASGKVPPQLLSDTVHYTAAAKTVIGNLIYKRCCELGIFEA